MSLGCGRAITVAADGGDETGESSGTSTSTSTDTSDTATTDTSEADTGNDTEVPDFGQPPPPGDCRGDVDILIVVDNSGTMGKKQQILGAAMPALVDAMDSIDKWDSGGILPPVTFSASAHHAQKAGFICELENGRFKLLTDWLAP